MTPPPTECIQAPSSGTRPTRECDFCGRALNRATSVEHVERAGDRSEIVTQCIECAVGVD